MSEEQHQMKRMDYVVVDLVDSAEGDENTEMAAEVQKQQSTALHVTISIELLLNTNWWMILVITIKLWSSSVKICIVDDKDTLSSFFCSHWNLK